MKFQSFILKALQLAVVADQAYAETQAPGANAGTLLQPNNFNNLLMELATVFAPQPAAPAPVATHAQAQAGSTEFNMTVSTVPPQPGMVLAPNGVWVFPDALTKLTPHWATDAPKGTLVGTDSQNREVYSNGPGAGYVLADGTAAVSNA